MSKQRTQNPSWWLRAFASLWMLGAVAGVWVLWSYENTSGIAAKSSAHWPTETRLQLASDRPTLVLLVHPQCVCTRETLAELAEALARAGTRPKTYVVFMKPSSFEKGWEKSGPWETAAGLPGTTALRDEDGREAIRFGAATSGQTMLYDTRGDLLFSGGITGTPGSERDNVGRNAVVALLDHMKPAARVYGAERPAGE